VNILGDVFETSMNMLHTVQTSRKVTGHSHGLRAFRWLSQWGALGIFTVAVIDFSIVPLPLPNSTDLLLLWLVSRGGSPWILVPSTVIGAVAGAYTTWHIGWSGGRAVLRRYRSLLVLDPVFRWIEYHPVFAALLFPLLPPPIPLTPLVLACGATGIARRRFFPAFGVALSLRYLMIAWLGKMYGRHIVHLWAWVLRRWSGPLFWIAVALFLATVGLSIWRAYVRNRYTLSKTQVAEATASRVD